MRIVSSALSKSLGANEKHACCIYHIPGLNYIYCKMPAGGLLSNVCITKKYPMRMFYTVCYLTGTLKRHTRYIRYHIAGVNVVENYTSNTSDRPRSGLDYQLEPATSATIMVPGT